MEFEKFVEESNRIENILRPPTKLEIKEFYRFVTKDKILISDLRKFVEVFAPGNVIRSKYGLDVYIGGVLAPEGGGTIPRRLQQILNNIEDKGPYLTHVHYELLHPFTDGNGRSGRALWAWQMFNTNGYLPDIGFLHMYYYQGLQHERKREYGIGL